MTMRAVVFDMDGVLVDSEVYWALAREEYAADLGKVWQPDAHRLVMGRATLEWAQVMQDHLALTTPPRQIADEMIARMATKYAERLPVRPGAIEAVKVAAAHYKVGLASGSPTTLIQTVMQLTGLDAVFETLVYGDDITHGKPAPDIYIEALRRLGVAASEAVGVEDSANGIRSLHAAGMRIIAAPSPAFPLSDDILALADAKIDTLEAFSLALVQGLG
ncbi:MAG: HAD family phosphatase [Armatimonadetes bacterium]|nr:HAD family phosphatase [Anaerolineae bacterium]